MTTGPATDIQSLPAARITAEDAIVSGSMETEPEPSAKMKFLVLDLAPDFVLLLIFAQDVEPSEMVAAKYAAKNHVLNV